MIDPIQGGESRNTLSRFTRKKSEMSAGLMGHVTRLQTLPQEASVNSSPSKLEAVKIQNRNLSFSLVPWFVTRSRTFLQLMYFLLPCFNQ